MQHALHIPVHMSVCMPLHMYVHMSVCMPLHMSVHPYVRARVCTLASTVHPSPHMPGHMWSRMPAHKTKVWTLARVRVRVQVSVETIVETMDALVCSGRIKAWGVSNWCAWTFSFRTCRRVLDHVCRHVRGHVNRHVFGHVHGHVPGKWVRGSAAARSRRWAYQTVVCVVGVETIVETMDALVCSGRIKAWGVSKLCVDIFTYKHVYGVYGHGDSHVCRHVYENLY